jgi:hypothetical protein
MPVYEQQVLSIVTRHDPVSVPDLVVKGLRTTHGLVELHCFVSLRQFIDRGKHGHAVSQLILVWKHHASGTPVHSWSFGKAPSPIAMTIIINVGGLDDAMKLHGSAKARSGLPDRVSFRQMRNSGAGLRCLAVRGGDMACSSNPQYLGSVANRVGESVSVVGAKRTDDPQ